MKKQEYLEDKIVADFIDWMIPRISGEIEFLHKYINRKDKSIWNCNSIFNAYVNYKWRFNCVLPEIEKISGSTYKESEQVLRLIEEGMKLSIQENNSKKLLMYSLAILEWGGVKRSNYNRLLEMKKDIIPYFQNSIDKLNPISTDSNDDFSGIIMNSGFTKLYSLLIDDFVIYDSRVGASLGLLTKHYLTEKGIYLVPELLNFAYGNARPTKSDSGKLNRRNPSNKRYKFPTLNNSDKKHIKNNIYANWLLKELSEKSKFKHENNPIRALESALFMIGYSVNE